MQQRQKWRGCIFLFEHVAHQVVGFPCVEDQREARLARRFDMLAQTADLRSLFTIAVVKIESGLANCNNIRTRRCFHQFLNCQVWEIL